MGLLIEVYLRVGLETRVRFGYKAPGHAEVRRTVEFRTGRPNSRKQHERVRSSSEASGVPAGLRTCSVTLAKSLCLGFLVVE